MPRGLIIAAVAFFLLIVIPFTVTYRAERCAAVQRTSAPAQQQQHPASQERPPGAVSAA
jgi:hypothetical protein